MAIVTDYLLLDLSFALSVFLLGCYYYLTRSFNYWKKRNVPFLKPTAGIGNFSFKHAYPDMIKELYTIFENERYCGIYQFSLPTLMIRDPILIEHILIKDFNHFEDRGMPLDEDNDPLSANLVNLSGNKWRCLRHKLTPSYTSGKLKRMFEQMCNCSEDALGAVEKYAAAGKEVNIKCLTASYSVNLIASCAFGLNMKCNTPEGKEFYKMANKALGNTRESVLRITMNMFFPTLAKLLFLKKTPSDVTAYFVELTKATIKHRWDNNIKREDFLQLLINLKQREDSGKGSETSAERIDHEDIHLQYMDKSRPAVNNLKFSDEMMAAQAYTFLAAGSESTATSISVALHYLATHPGVQRRLQDEVDSVLARHGGRWSYQTLKEMTYLDQIMQESQRLFPMGHVILRKCTAPYRVPQSDLVIEPGTSLLIPTIALHHDPSYYPDPLKFDPERFAGNNFKPSPVYMPFGDGPRICIAMKFAILEVKVFLARLMSRFFVSPGSRTINPLQYDPWTFSVRPLGGVWVSFRERDT